MKLSSRGQILLLHSTALFFLAAFLFTGNNWEFRIDGDDIVHTYGEDISVRLHGPRYLLNIGYYLKSTSPSAAGQGTVEQPVDLRRTRFVSVPLCRNSLFRQWNRIHPTEIDTASVTGTLPPSRRSRRSRTKDQDTQSIYPACPPKALFHRDHVGMSGRIGIAQGHRLSEPGKWRPGHRCRQPNQEHPSSCTRR